jgi:hypothetical protein
MDLPSASSFGESLLVDDDEENRIDAIPLPELRRRVAVGVGYLRELRSALAVESAMSLEGAPGPLPQMDHEQAQRVLEELIELLPVRRKLLTPEERAKLQPISAAEREAMKALFEAVAANPEEFDAAAAEAGSEVSSAELVTARERLEKMDLLNEVARESAAFAAELKAHQQQLLDEVEAMAGRILARGEAN